MAKTNVAKKTPKKYTHEGAQAVSHLNPIQQLRRSVMACMLWEDGFYESGESIVDRIVKTAALVPANALGALAVEAREKFKLRHAPLMLLVALVKKGGNGVALAIENTIQRADELTEFVSLYWKANPTGLKDERGNVVNAPLSNQMKKGLAAAFKKFDAYSLAKYNRDGEVKLRDVLFLVHAKPRDQTQAEVWKHLINGTLASPDTWEVELSAGKDKRATFERLIDEKKLFSLALLRNLRNMIEAKVPEDKIREAINAMKTERVLPFRFITAARYAPRLEDALESAMFKCLESIKKLPGKTALLVDHSRSMDQTVSAKSEVTRFEAAAAVGMILREIGERVRVFTFSDTCHEIAPRRGFGMLAALNEVRKPNGTYLGKAVKHIYKEFPECDRIIVITDEQSADRPPEPQGHGYIINVESYQNGIGYGAWTTITGFSEAILDYICEAEGLI